jgi:hypothetical protein
MSPLAGREILPTSGGVRRTVRRASLHVDGGTETRNSQVQLDPEFKDLSSTRFPELNLKYGA